MKILLVEDSATSRRAVGSVITDAGHDCIVAETGELALQLIESMAVDLVIMDVSMPGLDGFETTRLMRESLPHWLPIIFVTGKHDEADLQRGIEVGGDDYLIKPVSKVILLAKIRAMERIVEMRNQLTELNAELLELSERDSLTRLYNRRTFEPRAQEKWRRAARSGEPLSVLIMDIDHFKAYNDLYGHLAGDNCIQRVANVLTESLIRPGDLLARYGGEEFIALLPDTGLTGASHVAERLRKRVAELDIRHRGALASDYITLSIGGAVMEEPHGQKLLSQINAADRLLYVSKEQGRNRSTVRLFSEAPLVVLASGDDSLTAIVEQRLQTRARLRVVGDRDELLDTALGQRPEVVIIDRMLQQSTGFDLALAVRGNPLTAHIPILLLGGESGADLDAKLRPAQLDASLKSLLRRMDALLPD